MSARPPLVQSTLHSLSLLSPGHIRQVNLDLATFVEPTQPKPDQTGKSRLRYLRQAYFSQDALTAEFTNLTPFEVPLCFLKEGARFGSGQSE